MINHYKKILEDRNSNKDVKYPLYYHLIKLVGEEKFNSVIRLYFNKSYGDSFDNFFIQEFKDDFKTLHKALRQNDVFNNAHLDMLLYHLLNTDIKYTFYSMLRHTFDDEF